MKLSFEELLNSAMESEDTQISTVDEDQAIQDMTDRLNLLLTARGQIETDGQVCRAQVQDLVDEAGLELSDRCPINSYTAEPSQTNLTITVENIFESVKNIIAEIIVKTVEVLRKILDFLRRLLDPIFGYSKNYTAVREAATQIFDLDNEIAKALAEKEIHELSGKPREAYERAEALATEVKKEWDEQWSSLRADLLAQGNAFNTMQACGVHLIDTFNQVQIKIGLLSALLREKHRDPNHPVVARDIADKLDDVMRPINCKPYEVALTLLGYKDPYEPNQSLSIFSAWMHAELSKMHYDKPSETADIVDTASAALRANLAHHEAHGVMGNPRVQVKGDGEIKLDATELQKTIKNFQPAIDVLKSARPPVDPRGDLGQHFRAATLSLVSEFNGARSIIGDIVRSNGDIYRAYGQMTKYLTQALNMRIIMLRANGDVETIKAMEARLDLVRRALKLS